MPRRFLRSLESRLLAGALAIGLSLACAVQGESGDVLGSGGVGPVRYTTSDSRTPGFWGPDVRGISDYIGAGADSFQPPLQPRPVVHADRVALLDETIGDTESGELVVSRQTIEAGPPGYFTPVITRNETHLALAIEGGAGFAVLAATPNGFGPPLVTTTPVFDLAMTGDAVFVASGEDGVLAVPLE